MATRTGADERPMVRDNSALDARLASIEGHIRGVRKMVEDGTYCVDVIKQTFAVERALKRFEAELLRSHLSTCVPSGFTEGRSDDMVRELGDLFELTRK
jgi:DNA-binding FrmR family transcriptional regulator